MFFADTLRCATEKVSLQLPDIKHVLTAHNGDLIEEWKQEAEEIGFAPETLKNQHKSVGNTACTDVLIDLADFSKQSVFSADEIIALWVPCTGVQVAVVFIKWCCRWYQYIIGLVRQRIWTK